jgi:glycosyltransferase involved in cell wall biosynthesis
MIRIAIVSLTRSGLSGGGKKYLQNIVPLMRADARVGAVHVFVPKAAAAGLESDIGTIESWPDWDPYLGHVWLKRRIKELAPDVVFIPTARWLDFGRIPTVTMVRNMEAVAMPMGRNPAGEKIRNLVLAYWARVACRKAERIVAVSGFVRDHLVSRWGVAPDKVGVVHHGVEAFAPDAGTIAPEDGRFVFTAGSVRPYRGYEDVVNAMSVLQAKGVEAKLVIAGGIQPNMVFYEKELRDMIRGQGLESRVSWAGELSAQEMARCLSRCATFVMTSRIEACPNTALEALACGCQIISTKEPPMPEFLRDVARYYDAGDGAGLAQQLQAALSASAAEKTARADAARARAKDFPWTATAKNTIDQCEQAICATA